MLRIAAYTINTDDYEDGELRVDISMGLVVLGYYHDWDMESPVTTFSFSQSINTGISLDWEENPQREEVLGPSERGEGGVNGHLRDPLL